MKIIIKLKLMLIFILLSNIILAQANIITMKDSRGNDLKV
jgi:hypothetical protein